MVPDYETNEWQVGVMQDTGMIQIRVSVDGGFQDYWVPPDEGNSDYQKFLAWKAEGNSPKILLGNGA